MNDERSPGTVDNADPARVDGVVMHSFTDDELKWLEDFIYGRGNFAIFGTGITTHPGADANNRKIHLGCLVLEERGKIVRHNVIQGSVIWKPSVGA